MPNLLFNSVGSVEWSDVGRRSCFHTGSLRENKTKPTSPPCPGASLGFRLGPELLTHQKCRCWTTSPRGEHHFTAGPLGWVISFVPIFTAEQILDHLILLSAGPLGLECIALHHSRVRLL